jgi:hypothetical protein
VEAVTEWEARFREDCGGGARGDDAAAVVDTDAGRGAPFCREGPGRELSGILRESMSSSSSSSSSKERKKRTEDVFKRGRGRRRGIGLVHWLCLVYSVQRHVFYNITHSKWLYLPAQLQPLARSLPMQESPIQSETCPPVLALDR